MSGKKGKSGRRTANEERDYRKLTNVTFDYLISNFHKFREENKIRIALEIQKRAMPTKVESKHDLTFADEIKRLTLARKTYRPIDEVYEDIEMKHGEAADTFYYESGNEAD